MMVKTLPLVALLFILPGYASWLLIAALLPLACLIVEAVSQGRLPVLLPVPAERRRA